MLIGGGGGLGGKAGNAKPISTPQTTVLQVMEE